MIEKIMAAADCFGQWYQKLLKRLLFLIGDCRDFVSAELFHAASGIGQSL